VSRRSVPIVFLFATALSIAAVWAIFHIEDQAPPIRNVKVTPAFSPNGDGVKDVAAIAFRVAKPTRATVEIRDSHGSTVTKLKVQARKKAVAKWNGRDDRGDVADDGAYRIRVKIDDPGRTVDLPARIRVDTKPPKLDDDGSVTLDTTRVDSDRPTIRFQVHGLNGSDDRWIETYYPKLNHAKRIKTLRTIRSENDRKSLRWNDFVISARMPADATNEPCNYLLYASDRAGNASRLDPNDFVGIEDCLGIW
jgi:hypothetical protein